MIRQGILRINSMDEFLKFKDCVVAVDARYVIDVGVLEFAVEKALKSWSEGRNVAKSLPLEILLYISATRQIRDAIKIGVSEGVNEAVIIFLKDCNIDFEEKEVVRLDEVRIENVKRLYGISDEEIEIVGVERLPLLIRERIALFDVFKE